MNVDRVAELAATILASDELEAWVMRISGMTFTEIEELYANEGRPRSRSTIHRTYHRAETKLRHALDQETAA